MIDMRERARLLLMAVIFVAVPAAGVEWRSVGPDGGTVTAIAAATSERMLLAGTAEGLLFRSVDRAQTWERVGASLGGHQVLQIVINPKNAARVWVRTDLGIFRSSDRGNSFLQRLAGNVSQFAVAPANPDVVYASIFSVGSNELLKSTDGGATWAVPANAGLGIVPISVAVDAADPSIVYVAGYSILAGPSPSLSSLWRSVDGGATW